MRVSDTAALPAGFDQVLELGLQRLGLTATPDARSVIDGHVRLLAAWTTAINLTAIREPAEVAVHHVLDSLTAIPLVPDLADAARILDLGSGGGFPGLPIAALLPGTAVALLEPIGKKARFLDVVVEATGLAERVTVVRARAEALAGQATDRGRWPIVTCRAVGSTADLVELAFPLLSVGGSLIAWKRGDLDDELATARRAMDGLGGGTLEVSDVTLPELAGHKLVVATPTGPAPARFPRDPSLRRRRPW